MKKRAILFGMFHYNRSASITANDLPSTEIDVKTLEKRLKQLQFETVSYMDLCLKDMEQKITEFADTAPCDSLNVVYFSGHGGHSKGENYLYPVDFGNSLDARMSIEDSAFNLKRIQPLFKRKVKLLIIVDACRDKLKPDYACNYSEMVAPQDTYIAYATQFGDCSGCTPSISYFTEALCDNILTPNISVDRLFTDVRAALYLKHGRQISNSVNGFMSDISLNEQADHDKVGNLVLQFVDHYGDMYVDKYGPFAGDDLVFIDAAQYCGIMAIADGHGSKACPYSKSGSSIAVNVFCKVMDEFHASYAENLEMLLTYLNREGDTKVAQAVDAEWKRRVLKVHTNQKREVLLTEDGEKNKAEIYKQYGSTLVGLMITPIFVFAFQLGDGDISYVDQNGLDHLLEDEKILGVETHSLSKIDSWKKVVSAVRRRDEADGLPYMLMLSTDGFANSYKNADEFQKTCVDYFAMIQQYGADAVAANLKSWLSETSAMGCGDDITVLIAYFSDDTATESEAATNE